MYLRNRPVFYTGSKNNLMIVVATSACHEEVQPELRARYLKALAVSGLF